MAVVAAVLAVRGGGRSPSTADDPGVVHVHGLGVNPADGRLYVATHHGLYRLGDGEDGAERVSPAYQDTMAFTVVGPDRFLASGHPDLEDERLQLPDKPPLLGLVESSDGGRTWTPLSLLGEADFHQLAVAGSVVYAWNATKGEMLASSDRRSWERRSSVSLLALAVDPRSPDRLAAGGREGVVLSSDGGRTWTLAEPAPAVAALAWGETGLWGIDASGAVLEGREGGAVWEQVGSLPGPPQALAVDGRRLFAAVEESDRTMIYDSADGGRTWRLRHRGSLVRTTVTE